MTIKKAWNVNLCLISKVSTPITSNKSFHAACRGVAELVLEVITL